MKTIKKVLLAAILIIACTFVAKANTTQANGPEWRIRINETITAVGGCQYTVSGWIDISVGLGGVSVNGYDISISSPCFSSSPQVFQLDPYMVENTFGSYPSEGQIHTALEDLVLDLID